MAHRRQLIYVVTAYALCNSPRRSTLGGPPSDYVPVKHSRQGFHADKAWRMQVAAHKDGSRSPCTHGT